ncbi:hypothetical protein U1Q18_023333 [Sarracenia purpurea var. burkii]
MVDLQTVCCMCGDVGFPDKLFRCRNEERSARNGSSSKKSASGVGNNSTGIMTSRSEYSGDKIKQRDREESAGEKAKNPSGAPSPRPSTRRYKLLKDVMC